MIHLRILSGQKKGADLLVRNFPYTIGRARTDNLRLEDAGVWDKHLTFSYDPDEGLLLQHNPKALAMLNKETFEKARLKAGDIIEFGATRIQFWLSEMEPRNLKIRERLTWAALIALALAQITLFIWLN
jgi:pSer/pThr/pTyr-binding forkhead associated (FHA) protein